MNESRKTGIFCGCGGATLNVKFGNQEFHLLGITGCLRKEATGNLIPTNFRTENGVKVCDVNGYTITEYTLYNQRLYHFEGTVWSLPKDESSINSIEIND
jgi:hypothetical protein